jgi:hypothetical protein
MIAVDHVVQGRTDKSAIWEVNTETEYHEARRGTVERAVRSSPAE